MHTAIHIALVLSMPPLLLGVINKVKAYFAGRRGPPVFQLYFDLAKLFRKEMVISRTTSWVFRAGPIVSVATALVASLIVPFGAHDAPLSFTGDLVLFAYLFALARFFVAAAALDTGSAFEGMGAAREVSWACLAEPALFFGFLALARISGSLSLGPMLASPWSSTLAGSGAAIVLVSASWLVVSLVENCRVPFDDPNTHLELTMVHEVMVLDHSGPLFGMVLWGASLKLFVLSALVTRLVVPFQTDHAFADWGIFVASMLGVAVAIGVVESAMARVRLLRVPQLLVTAVLLSAFGMILLLR